jgi:hypothetical protein
MSLMDLLRDDPDPLLTEWRAKGIPVSKVREFLVRNEIDLEEKRKGCQVITIKEENS